MSRGEMRYQFRMRRPPEQPPIEATFQGPAAGVVFHWTLEAAREVRDALDRAIAQVEAFEASKQ